MLGKPHILSLFPSLLINSIYQEHLCKILYLPTLEAYNANNTDQDCVCHIKEAVKVVSVSLHDQNKSEVNLNNR